MIYRLLFRRRPDLMGRAVLASFILAAIGVLTVVGGWLAGDPYRNPACLFTATIGILMALESTVFAIWLKVTGQFRTRMGDLR